LFHTGSAPGIHPSELSPLDRIPPRFRSGRTHLLFRLTVYPRPKAQAGSTDRSSWVSASRESLATGRVISVSRAGCSLGSSPSRACHVRLGEDFAPPPLTRFPTRACTRTAAPQSLNRRPLRPTLCVVNHEVGWSNPSGVFAPACILNIQAASTRAMCSPHVASTLLPTGRRSLDSLPLYRSCQDRLRCRAFASRLLATRTGTVRADG
jgi:hypothetical protein